MTAPDVELRRAWTRLAGRGHDLVLERFLEHLREPHRRYHTATHVMWVLRHVDSLLLAGHGPVATDEWALRWAALYHDAVYDATRPDNEERSAEVAMRHANDVGRADDTLAAIRRLIMVTAGHRPTAPDEAVLNDADLAILGAEPHDYLAYCTGVRAEYGHLDDEAWRDGRAAVLRSFLAMDAIFATAAGRHRWETRARGNITAELASLADR